MALDSNDIRVYRKFIFDDADVPRTLPTGLESVHKDFFETQRGVFHRSSMSDDAYTFVFLFWKYQTNDGRAHYGLPLIKFENAAVAHDVVPTVLPVEQGVPALPRLAVRTSPRKGALAPSRKPSIWTSVKVGAPVKATRRGESFEGSFAGAGAGGIKVKTSNGTVVSCHPTKVTLV